MHARCWLNPAHRFFRISSSRACSLLEQDATTVGEVVGNFCWQGVVTASGAWEIGCSEQLIAPLGDEWWGSRSVPRDSLQAVQIDRAAMLRFFREVGYSGPVGPDFMVVREPDGGMVSYWIDPNGRAAISTTAFMVSHALHGPESVWLNCNITLPQKVSCFDELAEQVGPGLLAPGGEDGVQAVVLSSRTEPGYDYSDVIKLWLGSSLENGREACARALNGLAERGIAAGC